MLPEELQRMIKNRNYAGDITLSNLDHRERVTSTIYRFGRIKEIIRERIKYSLTKLSLKPFNGLYFMMQA